MCDIEKIELMWLLFIGNILRSVLLRTEWTVTILDAGQNMLTGG